MYDGHDFNIKATPVPLFGEQWSRTHSDDAIDKRGEIFTPEKLVNQMLDLLPKEAFSKKQKDEPFLDQSCGNGQFLAAVLQRKMENGISHETALKSIYGVELDPANAEECRKRLLMGFEGLRHIVERNIICADALDPKHKGWKKVGFYWKKPKHTEFWD